LQNFFPKTPKPQDNEISIMAVAWIIKRRNILAFIIINIINKFKMSEYNQIGQIDEAPGDQDALTQLLAELFKYLGLMVKEPVTYPTYKADITEECKMMFGGYIRSGISNWGGWYPYVGWIWLYWTSFSAWGPLLPEYHV
jgi:hypothetical protein